MTQRDFPHNQRLPRAAIAAGNLEVTPMV